MGAVKLEYLPHYTFEIEGCTLDFDFSKLWK